MRKHPLYRFLQLPQSEKYLFIISSGLLLAIRLGLRLLPFSKLLHLLNRFSTPHPNRMHAMPTRRVAWVVDTTSRRLLGAESCLPRALTGHLLLKRYGYPARLRIGVSKAEDGRLMAHAWVETDDGPIIGGTLTELEGYQTFPEIALDHQ